MLRGPLGSVCLWTSVPVGCLWEVVHGDQGPLETQRVECPWSKLLSMELGGYPQKG